MPSLSGFLRNPLSWMPFLGLLLAGFLGYSFFSSIFLTSVLTLSATFISNFSNKKLAEKSVKAVSPNQEYSPSHCLKDHIITKAIVEENEEKKVEDYISQIDECLTLSKTQNEEVQEQEMEDPVDQIDEYLTRSPLVILPESDGCLGRSSTSEDFEVDWPFQDHNMFRSPDCSDGSISDEESLIEIALPSGHYIADHNKQDHQDIISNKTFKLHKKLPNFSSTGPLFKHGGGLMELLAELNEMNEEENLIEIDISIGSIKYPRFEIEA